MQPSEKCVSLETAGKLKEAGFPQETEHWFGFEGNFMDGRYPATSIAAPDATEIGVLLPEYIEGQKLYCWRSDIGWHVGYFDKPFTSSQGLNEAEARAACWLYLKQNNLL